MSNVQVAILTGLVVCVIFSALSLHKVYQSKTYETFPCGYLYPCKK